MGQMTNPKNPSIPLTPKVHPTPLLTPILYSKPTPKTISTVTLDRDSLDLNCLPVGILSISPCGRINLVLTTTPLPSKTTPAILLLRKLLQLLMLLLQPQLNHRLIQLTLLTLLT